MMRNGCLILCQFQIPSDVIFDYKRLVMSALLSPISPNNVIIFQVKILLHIVSENSSEDSFNQRAGIFLLNSLACQVDGEQKVLVGSLGAVEKMLQIISEKLEQGHCEDVMLRAWNTMLNVTDGTPLNCERFLAAGGMFLFLKCKVSLEAR